MSDQVSLQEGREKIFPVLIFYLRQCYIAHNDGLFYGRDQILTLIDMCVESLLTLETNPKDIENIIVSLGFRAFPRNYDIISWYSNRILGDNLLPDDILSLEREDVELSTKFDSDDEN